jgi:hypothetical protein
MRCAFCNQEMAYIHGHAACVRSGCQMYGVNQAECCDGETAEAAPVRTSEVAPVRTSEVAAAPAGRVRERPAPPPSETPRRR